MTFSAGQIAQLTGGRVEGNPAAAVSGFGKIEEAVPGQLAFLANPKYEEYLYTTGASVVIINETQELKQEVKATLIRVQDAYSAFAVLLGKYQAMQEQALSGRQEPSWVHDTATIGSQVFIGAFAYIGRNARIADDVKIHPQVYIGDDVTIGPGSILHAGVKIYHRCVLGSRVIVHAGTVVGSDGFGFAPQADGSLQKVPQTGNVIIEDDVEIGANSTIDRATIGSTIIRAGAKIDNLVQIAHNVEVGSYTVMAAQSGVSGSTKIGRGVMIGGQAGIVGHIRIGDKARINAQSGVSKSLDEGQTVTGSPAYDYTATLRSQAVSRRLPELEKRLRELEAMVSALKDKS